MSPELEGELTNHFSGLKRKIAANIQAGEGEIKVGKDPLCLQLFRFLGFELLVDVSRESIFARTFMIICWNLMARASNAFEVCINHMEWREDVLCIYFCQMKNDQLGRDQETLGTFMQIHLHLKFVESSHLPFVGLVTVLWMARYNFFQELTSMKDSGNFFRV